MRAWSQLAATVPVQNARPHSGSYSFMFCGGSSGCAGSGGEPRRIGPRARSMYPGSSVGNAACIPAQSPTDHPSPSHLLNVAKTGPAAWRIECPQAGSTSEAKSGGSSHTTART